MSTIDPVASSSPSGATNKALPSGQLAQNEFLKLMIAQLKNQDPMKPLDPSAFLGQLAQFSTVTSIQNVETSMSDLSSAMRSSQVLSGTTLVGREVLAPATEARFDQGTRVHGAVDVPEGTTTLQVRISDANGKLIRTFAVPPQQGLTEFTWDGLDDVGNAAASGTYQIEVIASSGNEYLSLQPMLSSRVESVTIDPSSHALTLNTNLGPRSLSTVRRVM